jgi:hypothetical protein
MRNRRGLFRQLIVAIIFVTAVAIPVYFITDAYIDREDLTFFALLDNAPSKPTKTSTPTITQLFPPTWTPRPSPTTLPTKTPTPTITSTPTEIIIPITGTDFSDAYIDSVLHLPEAGGRTMVTIVVSGVVEGEFYAWVEIGDDNWLYECVIRSWSDDHLFCFGGRLPGTTQARIAVYEVLEDETEKLVFEADFAVAQFVPTKTPTSSVPRPTATETPTPTNTFTPSATMTPSSTFTSTPTYTPTNTSPPPPSPWVPTDTPESDV